MNIIKKFIAFWASKIMIYAGLLDDLFQDLIGDLKSFRVQLVYWAWAFTFFCVFTSPSNVGNSLLLLGTAYGFYFSSKFAEHKVPNRNLKVLDEEPPSGDRDPDNI